VRTDGAADGQYVALVQAATATPPGPVGDPLNSSTKTSRALGEPPADELLGTMSLAGALLENAWALPMAS
jgi:hypothetical protein